MHSVTWIDMVLLNYHYERLIHLLEEFKIPPDRLGSTALLMASMNVARSDGASKEDYMAWAAFMWDSMRDNRQNAVQN